MKNVEKLVKQTNKQRGYVYWSTRRREEDGAEGIMAETSSQLQKAL